MTRIHEDSEKLVTRLDPLLTLLRRLVRLLFPSLRRRGDVEQPSRLPRQGEAVIGAQVLAFPSRASDSSS